MTPHTSSRSANTTTSGQAGQLHTAQRSGAIWPRSRMSKLEFELWQLYVRIRHALGRHTYVPIEHWSFEGGEALVEITGRICWLCDERQSFI